MGVVCVLGLGMFLFLIWLEVIPLRRWVCSMGIRLSGWTCRKVLKLLEWWNSPPDG